MNIVCLGASFTGRYLADHFSGENSVFFVSRAEDIAPASGYHTLTPGNFDRVLPPNGIDMVLDTIPAIVSGDVLRDPPYVGEVARILERSPSAAYVHISTTSVYGAGSTAAHESQLPTVNEKTPPEPQGRGKNRLLLERRILDLYPEARIIRSGALYGPGRCIAIRFREGEFRKSDAINRMISRIHVHDLCRLILAVGTHHNAETATLVNGVDEHPSPNSETFSYIEDALGISIPGGWKEAQPEGRRVVSLYASQLLKGSYQFPTYKEGFPDCLG